MKDEIKTTNSKTEQITTQNMDDKNTLGKNSRHVWKMLIVENW